MSFHLDLKSDPAVYARIAEREREWLRDMADAIERGQPLSEGHRVCIAAILRDRAEKIPQTLPRKRGQAPRINPSSIAMEFELLIRKTKLSKNAARERLAEKHGVTVEAIRIALSKKGADAKAFFDLLRYPSK